MRTLFTLLLLVLNPTLTTASADSALLDSYTWGNRLLLIFTPDQNHPEFIAQNVGLARIGADLIDRDLVVLRLMPAEEVTIDGNISSSSNSDAIYSDFAIETSEFRVLLIGKDGTIKLSRHTAVDAIELFELIDSMPMRQMEIQTRGTSVNPE